MRTIFGATLDGTPLTREAVTELVGTPDPVP